MRPKIAIMADVPNWAWGRKASHLQRWLSDEFDITVWLLKYGAIPDVFDLYHTFDFPNVTWVPEGKPCVTGITAHVWPTWGSQKVRLWASRAEAIHVNSILLLAEMEQFASASKQSKVFYVPNGVCPNQFRRWRTREEGTTLVVGHQGKPNPRKGEDVISAAVELARERGADIDYRLNQRTSKDALSVEEMVDWYQDLHLLAVCSDMDGTPNPALEAAACEVAPLSNAIGNMPEFIEDGFNGWLLGGLPPHGFDRGAQPEAPVEHADLPELIEDYANTLLWAAENRLRVRDMGKAAQVTVRANWTWEKQAEHYRIMWNSVLAGLD